MSGHCDLRSMQPEETHPVDLWNARASEPAGGLPISETITSEQHGATIIQRLIDQRDAAIAENERLKALIEAAC